MDAVMSSVQDMAKQVDEAGRKKLIDTLTGLIHSIEGPQDLMQRLLYMVSMPWERKCQRSAADSSSTSPSRCCVSHPTSSCSTRSSIALRP